MAEPAGGQVSELSRNDVLDRRHKGGITWLELAVEFAEETVENGPSAYVAADTAEAVAQVLLALVAERKLLRSHEGNSDWCPVSSPPTDKAEYVHDLLVVDTYGNRATAIYDGYSQSFDVTPDRFMHPLTHWRHLPAAPESRIIPTGENYPRTRFPGE